MSKTVKWIIGIVCVILLVGGGLFLLSRHLSEEEASAYKFATIWKSESLNFDEAAGNYDVDFGSASNRVKMARRGFEKGIKANPGIENFEEEILPEMVNQRSFSEYLADTFSSEDIVLTIGATTDEMTMDTSMEMNFFNIPMLIPFADGDLAPDDSPVNYSIRMTPTAQKYAEYFNNLFPASYFSTINNILFQDKAIPDYNLNVAVFFADNFNGHNTAVNITQRLLDNGYNVEIYTPFNSLLDLLHMLQTSWNTEADKLRAIDVLIVIGEDGASMKGLSGINQLWMDRGLEPMVFLVGFLSSDIENEVAQARNIYSVHQQLDFINCPSEIVNRSEAMGYAAGYIVSLALKRAHESEPPEPSGLQLLFSTPDRRRQLHQEHLTSYRENVRTVLLEMNEDIPCYGVVDFDLNSDSNIYLETVRYLGPDNPENVGTGIVFNYLLDKLQRDYNLETETGD